MCVHVTNKVLKEFYVHNNVFFLTNYTHFLKSNAIISKNNYLPI